MDLRTGQPYWLALDGDLGAYPPLNADVRCEVAVVGGGVTGAMIADELTRGGVDAVLIEKRRIGHGSTAASTGLLLYEIDTPLVELTNLVGRERAEGGYRASVASLGMIENLVASLDDDCGFARRKCLYLASGDVDARGFPRECEARRAIGINVEYWSSAEIESRFPFTAPAALWSHDAAEIDAYRLTHRLVQRAMRHGLRAFDETCVTNIERHARGVTLRTQQGQRIDAKRLMIACGYESGSFLPGDAGKLHSTYVLCSEPVTPAALWHERCLIWESARPYFYARTSNDHRILIGGADVPFRDAAARDLLIARQARLLRERFAQMFKSIPFTPAYAWAGTFGETRDGLPYIGTLPSQPETSYALGFGGNGITSGMLAARILSMFSRLMGADSVILPIECNNVL